MAKKLSAYERVKLARDTARPNIAEYIHYLFTDFEKLSGDRLGKEDEAVLGGIGRFHGRPVTIIGHRKGRDLEKNLKYNFGMAGPEGYRKGIRLMKQAEKFGRPVITIIDTPGAYPGKEAEENGQSVAIAESMSVMSALKVPVIAIVTGEGSSGGALAIAVANQVWMLENAVYSILSPEGFASILWKDADKAAEASEAMRITAAELLEDGLIDGIIPEADGGIQKNAKPSLQALDKMLTRQLKDLCAMTPEELVEQRYARFRRIGVDEKYWVG